VDQQSYRRILGHFVSGVAIVTGMSDSGPVGLAVNSFTAVSLDPPLVAFFPATK
jgi:3-hydroxy-9,10-secoandrosta-1,3,5(10)-triene-9,17-dione monooxygenase reductase component